jgi:hypothetical protein
MNINNWKYFQHEAVHTRAKASTSAIWPSYVQVQHNSHWAVCSFERFGKLEGSVQDLMRSRRYPQRGSLSFRLESRSQHLSLQQRENRCQRSYLCVYVLFQWQMADVRVKVQPLQRRGGHGGPLSNRSGCCVCKGQGRLNEVVMSEGQE